MRLGPSHSHHPKCPSNPVTSDHIIVMDTAFVSEMEDLLGKKNSTAMKAQSSDTILYIIDRMDCPMGVVMSSHNMCLSLGKAPILLQIMTAAMASFRYMWGTSAPMTQANLFSQGCRMPLTALPFRQNSMACLWQAQTLAEWVSMKLMRTGQVLSQNWLPDARLWGGPTIYTVHERGQQQYDTMWWLSFGISPELRVQRVDLPMQTTCGVKCRCPKCRPKHIQAPLFVSIQPQSKLKTATLFPLGRWPSSPTFIPRVNGGANEGFIVTTVMSDDTSTADQSGDEFWIFDAQNLEQGPLCRLGTCDLKMPPLLQLFYGQCHSRTASYQVDLQGEIESRIGNLRLCNSGCLYSDVFPYMN